MPIARLSKTDLRLDETEVDECPANFLDFEPWLRELVHFILHFELT
jgi:hypothetical protein